MSAWRQSVAAVLGLVVTASAHAQSPDAVTLEVPGRTNAAPWVASHGQYVAVTWAATASGSTDVFVATSRDGGRSFGAPVQVNRVAGDARVGGEIPPRVALHAPTGAAEPEVVVAWNAKDQGTEIKVARSSDGGRTFDAGRSLQSAGAAGDRGWHALAVDEGGVAHVLWLDHRGLAAAKADHQHKGEHDGVAMAQQSGLRYATLGGPTAGDRQLTSGVCYCCKTALAALPGGRLVAAWRHVYAGNLRDIAFTESRDGGRTFATVARVSEDGWAINGCPDDGPALATGRDGRVHVVWPTVIPGDQPTGALFYAVGGDRGGFSPRVRVPTLGAPKPSHPQVIEDAHGRVVVAWDEVLDGVRIAAFVTGEPTSDGAVRFGRPQRLVPGAGPTLYPVLAAVGDEVVAVFTAGAPSASTIRVARLHGPDSPAATPGQTAPAMPGHQPPPGADHMQHRFDDPERYAKGFDDPARDAWQMPDRVIAALALKPGDRVADIGAGTGYFSTRLARAAARPTVFAADIEPAMVGYLAKRAAAEGLANMRAVQASATSPQLPEPVDVVLVVDTFHHIGNRTAYFAGLRRQLRPGGRVAIVDFRKDAPGDGPPAHFRFTPDQITAEMSAAGYVLDAGHDFLPRQHLLIYRPR
ncbi:MAG: methyltransferase domain-containing protein [Vicinamibacterales bacterium]